MTLPGKITLSAIKSVFCQKQLQQKLSDHEILQITYDDLQKVYNSIAQAERLGRIIIEQVFCTYIERPQFFFYRTHLKIVTINFKKNIRTFSKEFLNII